MWVSPFTVPLGPAGHIAQLKASSLYRTRIGGGVFCFSEESYFVVQNNQELKFVILFHQSSKCWNSSIQHHQLLELLCGGNQVPSSVPKLGSVHRLSLCSI